MSLLLFYTIIMNICRVKGCRFSGYHITARHHCGRCGLLGHGQVECGDDAKISFLSCIDVSSVSVPCTAHGCSDPYSHTSEGHCCLYCALKDGHYSRCPVVCPVEKDDGAFAQHDIIPDIGKYIHQYGGLGCSEYIRCNKETGKLEYFFMHSDSWGQYGKDTSDVPALNAFIYGYVRKLI